MTLIEARICPFGTWPGVRHAYESVTEAQRPREPQAAQPCGSAAPRPDEPCPVGTPPVSDTVTEASREGRGA